jgi:hypothetical protein
VNPWFFTFRSNQTLFITFFTLVEIKHFAILRIPLELAEQENLRENRPKYREEIFTKVSRKKISPPMAIRKWKIFIFFSD